MTFALEVVKPWMFPVEPETVVKAVRSSPAPVEVVAGAPLEPALE